MLYPRREHTVLPIQAFPCELANVVPNDGKGSLYNCYVIIIMCMYLFPIALSEEGLVTLQSLVEGMILEVHITGHSNAPVSPNLIKTEPPSDSPTSPDEPPSSDADQTTTEVAEPEASEKTEKALLKWFHIPPTPLVELYTKFGSDVSKYTTDMHLYNSYT